MGTSIKELQALTDSEKLYRINERLEDFHGSFVGGYNWKQVLDDKWHMLVWQGGSL